MNRIDQLCESHGGNVETLARTYTSALKRFFQRRILEHADVDDMVQDVLLRLIRRGDLSGITDLEGYVFQTAKNVLRDRLRQRFSRQEKDVEPISEDYGEDAALSPERVLLGREALDRLSTALQEMPERRRTVFMLCRVEVMPYLAVARRLGISLSAVDKHMANAMDYLMERMKEDL